MALATAMRNVDYHSHENEHNINIKPLSFITGLIRECQHINPTNTVGYYSIQERYKVTIQQNLLLPACLKVLFFTNKYMNSFKSEIHLNNINKFSSCHTGHKLHLHYKSQSVNATLGTNGCFVMRTVYEYTQYEQFIVQQVVHIATTVFCRLKHYIIMFLCFVKIFASTSRCQ
jgi:hypothetical protein